MRLHAAVSGLCRGACCLLPAIAGPCLLHLYSPRPLLPAPCPAARSAMRKIQLEDKDMVEQLRYDQLPAEYSVRADLPQVMFRKLRQQVRAPALGGLCPGWCGCFQCSVPRAGCLGLCGAAGSTLLRPR